MHYGVLNRDGRVQHVECNPQKIDDWIKKLNGSLIIQANTLELYQQKLSQDPNRHIDSWLVESGLPNA